MSKTCARSFRSLARLLTIWQGNNRGESKPQTPLSWSFIIIITITITEVCQLLKQLQPLLKAKRFLSEQELDLLEKLCLEVGVLFPRVFKGTVTPKIHDLVFHLPRIARHLGTVGGVREDNLESKHAIGNSLRRRLACVRAEEEKLKLMLQLDEVQLRLKSAEFSKPATSRVRKRKNGTG